MHPGAIDPVPSRFAVLGEVVIEGTSTVLVVLQTLTLTSN